MPTSLVICRSIEGLPVLRRIRGQFPIVVASDDPRVQEVARSLSGVQSVCYIEQTESFYCVADEVIRLLTAIDDGLRSIDAGQPNEVMSWGRNIEGGITNQRVQDLVLLVRSYRSLFSVNVTGEVHIISNPRALWEDRVLIASARAQELPVHRHSSQWVACRLRAVTEGLRPWAVSAFYLGMLIRAGCLRFSISGLYPTLDKAVVFQSNSSLSKHIENIRPVMRELIKRGLRPVALCWEASERNLRAPASSVLSGQGLDVVRLEEFLTIRDLWTSFVLGVRMKGKSLRLKMLWRQLHTNGVPLYPLLDSSLAHFFIAEFPQRLRYENALSAVLPHARPIALKLFGGPESFHGKAALRLIDRRKGILIFHYWIGTAPAWPYADGHGKIDLFLAKGPSEVMQARNDYALDPTQIVITGQVRFSPGAGAGADSSPKASRQALGLPTTGYRYIGFDPNGALRGFFTVREQTELTAALVDAARAHPRLLVVVKPHPSYSIDHLKPMLTEGGIANIYVLPRDAPIEHFLNAIDFVVTKYSTLILEAALRARVAISALFDGESRFKIYGDLPVIIRSPVELTTLLVSLADDAVYYTWLKAQLARQASLLPEYYSALAEDPSKAAVNAILRNLIPAATAASRDRHSSDDRGGSNCKTMS